MLICALTVITRRRGGRPSTFRPDRVTAALGLTGAVGLLLSSATLYVTYRPYSELFEHFIHEGDRGQVRELSAFLGHTQILPGVHNFYQSRDFVFYFWIGVTLLCIIGPLLVLMWHFLSRSRANAPA